MQLKPKTRGSIGIAIAKASLALTCATTSITNANEVVSHTSDAPTYDFINENSKRKKWAKWSGEFGFLGYKENDGRVQALEPAILLNANYDEDKVWSVKLVVDTLTGASPNGALQSAQPQTFTTPSGKSTFTTNPGSTPLDSSFRDTRVSLNNSWLLPLSQKQKLTSGFTVSNEYDYLSIGAQSTVTTESEDKNYSYVIGVAYTYDSIKPVGGVPVPLATMTPPASAQPKNGSSETKNTFDLLLGYSKVMSQNWILLTNLSVGYSSGYMNDPYKIVTIFNNTNGDAQSYIYEQRPDTRLKQSFYIGSKNYINGKVLTTAYRFLTDDWGMLSHTVDASYNFPLSKKWNIEPGMRYYLQNEVDFYDFAIADNENIPKEVSADNRLADFNAVTGSIKINRKLQNDRAFNLIFKYYAQRGDAKPSDAIGSQRNQNLYPDVDAYIIQGIYIF